LDKTDDGMEAFGATAAGTGGGVLVGAGIGTLILPGVGTAIGAISMGLIGGFGAFLNRDEIANQAARAVVQTELAEKKIHQAAAFSTGLQAWGGVAMNALSP